MDLWIGNACGRTWSESIRALHLLGVSVGDTDEVGVSNAKSGGLGKHDEEVELLGHLWVSVGLWVTLSSENSVVLVDEYVVADDPDGNQGGGDDSEHAGGEKFSSGGGGVLGEENNKEAGSNAHWGEEDQNDDWEVPVDVIIKDQEEVHSDQVDAKEAGKDTNSNDTALNGEAAAAPAPTRTLLRGTNYKIKEGQESSKPKWTQA